MRTRIVDGRKVIDFSHPSLEGIQLTNFFGFLPKRIILKADVGYGYYMFAILVELFIYVLSLTSVIEYGVNPIEILFYLVALCISYVYVFFVLTQVPLSRFVPMLTLLHYSFLHRVTLLFGRKYKGPLFRIGLLERNPDGTVNKTCQHTLTPLGLLVLMAEVSKLPYTTIFRA